MIAKFFIDRPVFASVISIIIVIAGLVAMRSLPIEQYPEIVPPEVTVSATYPGASAESIASTVAAPLEQQINGVEKMLYMRSTSTGSGTLSITVTFAIGTDPDQATINVNNRVQRALPLLPQEVQRLLRHRTLRITLETYVHWWPKRERRRGVVGSVLQAAVRGNG